MGRGRWIAALLAAALLVVATATVTRALTSATRQIDMSITGTVTVPDGYFCRAGAAPPVANSCDLVNVSMPHEPVALGVTKRDDTSGFPVWQDVIQSGWQSPVQVFAVARELTVRLVACPGGVPDEQCQADAINHHVGGVYRYWAIQYMGR